MIIQDGDMHILDQLEELVDPTRSAVIVIDVQNGVFRDFLSSDADQVRSELSFVNITCIIPPIQELLDSARKIKVPVVYSEFIHRSSLGVSLMDGPSMYCVRNLTRFKSWVEGSEIAETVPELAPQPGEFVFQKSRGSAFYGTLLDNHLKRLGVQSLIITGAVTNGCVLMTAVDAMHRGYYPIVLSDCVGAYDLEWHELALQWIVSQFPVFSSPEVLAVWKRSLLE